MKDLPALALRARQPKTVRNYKYGWERWRKWASQFQEVSVLPADSSYVALYLLEIYQGSRTHAPVSLAYYSISWAHRTAGLADPTLDPLPKMVKDAAPRTLVYFSNKKQPVSVDILRKIVHKYANAKSDLMNVRLATMCIIAFSGFLRFQEISNLRYCDIVFANEYVKLFIESSKTDVHRQGAWVFIARMNSELCPVSLLERYLSMAGFSTYSECFIFRGVTRNKDPSKRKLKFKNVPLSYTTARVLILQAFQDVGMDPSLFGTHSLRAGGATAAANNKIPDRLFKKHGRWCSDRSKDRYVHESIQQKLLVSRNLGL